MSGESGVVTEGRWAERSAKWEVRVPEADRKGGFLDNRAAIEGSVRVTRGDKPRGERGGRTRSLSLDGADHGRSGEAGDLLDGRRHGRGRTVRGRRSRLGSVDNNDVV